MKVAFFWEVRTIESSFTIFIYCFKKHPYFLFYICCFVINAYSCEKFHFQKLLPLNVLLNVFHLLLLDQLKFDLESVLHNMARLLQTNLNMWLCVGFHGSDQRGPTPRTEGATDVRPETAEHGRPEKSLASSCHEGTDHGGHQRKLCHHHTRKHRLW